MNFGMGFKRDDSTRASSTPGHEATHLTRICANVKANITWFDATRKHFGGVIIKDATTTDICADVVVRMHPNGVSPGQLHQCWLADILVLQPPD
jgi:hypothetical protein